ncbi:hypothetical protein DSCA_16120 [Desulfosarcina alkanivorans]|uniref:Uncharacterized protein n=1 Tax=Desulfosarcina alkanivorans TaxID=571177 RepID=A0A5K7YDV3_9BACT|nr:hypothetical protein [Desulfosarcina alkanivorans]BBO67682.1 hypothetical protein DSCA_16120 [Desulfosarcina alkanivorans]
MTDPIPYIVVDNQIILPVGRIRRPGPSAGDPESQKQPDFGVVDRVTISRQARQKCRQAQFDAAPPSGAAMLTHTPEKLR